MPGTFTHVFDTPTYKGSITVNTGLFINGQWVDPVEKGMIEIVNPVTGKVFASAAGGSSKDVDIAVAAATKAYRAVWGLKKPGAQRGKLLNKLAELVEKHQEELKALEALNSGKPFHVAQIMDINLTIEVFRYFAGWADKIHGKTTETNEAKFSYTRHEPYGVVGAITPWNFPLAMATLKLAPALATGNVVILKPSEMTPLSTLYLADLINKAGFPPGVVNIINGYGNTVGAAISHHPDIMKLTFTGSTVTGRKLLKAAAESNLKKVTLELGGKSPTIIFDDADLEQAVKWASLGIFFNMGQGCIAGSRIYVQEKVYDKFLQGLTHAAEAYSKATGNPFEPGVLHGPQISQTQFDRVMGYINSGKEQGARVHIGGERHGEEGYFIEPTIFVDAKADMKIMREEIFGPVCCVVKFKSEEEVIEWANDTTYGLAANVLTQNVSRAIRMANALEVGMVYVNCAMSGSVTMPFGGYKQSGMGRELGAYALDAFTQVKAVHVNIGQML